MKIFYYYLAGLILTVLGIVTAASGGIMAGFVVLMIAYGIIVLGLRADIKAGK